MPAFRISLLFVLGLTLSMLAFSLDGVDQNLGIRTCILSFTVLGVCLQLLYVKRQLIIRLDSILILYLLFILWSAFSGARAINQAEFINQLVKDLLMFAVFLIGSFFLNSHYEEFTVLFVRTLIIVVAASLLTGLIQMAGIPELSKEYMYLIAGNHAHKNLFASFLFLSSFFLIYNLREMPEPWKALAAVVLAGSFVFLILLMSKAVWLGLITAAAIFASGMVLKTPGKNTFKKIFIKTLATVCGILILLHTVYPLILRSLIVDSELPTLATIDQERLQLWHKTYHMVQQYPIAGVGGGNWQVHFPDATLTGIWRAEDLNVSFQRPHNDLLWILAENGTIGLGLFLAFVLLLCFQSYRNAQKKAPDSVKDLLCASFICGYLVIAFCDFPRERIEHGILLNLLFAFTYFRIKQQNEIGMVQQNKSASRVFLPLATVIFLVCACISVLRYRSELSTRLLYDARDQGRSDLVIKQSEEALSFFYSLDPTSIPLNWYAGNAYANLGEFSKAKNAFERAYRQNPFHRNVLNDLGSACVFVKENERAKKLYAEASRISPRFDEPKLNLAAIYIQEKNYEKADSCLKTLLHDSERRKNYQIIVDARP